MSEERQMTTHEPECRWQTEHCECWALRLAYKRGMEKAAQRVEALRRPFTFARDINGNEFPQAVSLEMACAAARGDGNGKSDTPEAAYSLNVNEMQGNAAPVAFDNHNEQTIEHINSGRQTEHVHSTCQDSASTFTSSTPSESVNRAHEPECFMPSDGDVLPEYCAFCQIVRTAYLRGRADEFDAYAGGSPAAHDAEVRADEREKAAQRVEAEHLGDGLDNDSDDAYNAAIRHAAAAARGENT